METKITTARKDWSSIERMARVLIEDEMDMLSPNDLRKIEENIDKGIPLKDERHNGMAFGWGEAINLVSIALTSIVLVKDFYSVYKKTSISVEDVMKWVLETEGIIPSTIPAGTESKIAEFLKEHMTEIMSQMQP